LRRGEARHSGPGGTAGGEDRARPEFPEGAALDGAVVVVGGAQRGSAERLAAASALDRGRVDEQHLLLSPRASLGKNPLNHSIVLARGAPRHPWSLAWPARCGCPSGRQATARTRRSDGMAMIAPATQRVTGSAGETLRRPLAGPAGKRSPAVQYPSPSRPGRNVSYRPSGGLPSGLKAYPRPRGPTLEKSAWTPVTMKSITNLAIWSIRRPSRGR
jgi:hypothetical protein